MESADDNALANISSHILIRDRNTKQILLNKNVKKSLRIQNIQSMEVKQDE